MIRKDSLKTGAYYGHFCLNLKNLGWPYREYVRQQKMVGVVTNCTVKMTLSLF